MRPRWRKVLADLWGHRIRSVLVIASIAVGLFAIGMITSGYVILMREMPVSYAKVNPANIQIQGSFDLEFVDRVENLPGVLDAAAVTGLDLRLRAGPEQMIPIEVTAIPDFDEMTINTLDLLEGTWPPGNSEIALDVNKADETHAGVGDEVEIHLPSGTVRRLRVCAIVHDQTIGSRSGGGGYFIAPVQGYIAFDTLEWLERPQLPNRMLVRVSENPNDRAHIQNVADAILDEFERNGYSAVNAIVRRSEDHPNITYLDAMAGVLFMLGLLVVFLSGFLITNTLSALLNQQIQQIGVMKTIGATSQQINGVYIVLILAYSLIALVIAVPLSHRAAVAQLTFLTGQLNFNLQQVEPVPVAILVQAVIALVVPQLAGAIPILQGTRISIQEALNGVGTGRDEARGRIHRLLARIRGLSRPMLISLRNTFRRRLRLALTLITLVLGGAIFIATFSVRTSLDAYIERLTRYFVADVNVTFSRPYRLEEIENAIQQVPGVVAVEGWAAARGELYTEQETAGETVQISGPPLGSALIEPIMREGRWLQPGDHNAIVLGELFVEEYPDLKVGDTLRLKINGRDTQWTVVGFFQFAGKNAGLVAYTDYDSLARLIGQTGQSFVYRVVAGDEMHSLEAQTALSLALENHLDEIGYRVTEVRAGKALLDSTSGGLNTLTIFLLIMAGLMALVGSIGLMGTMSLNVMERTREIGVMRAIGASDRSIMKLVIVEGMLVGVMSWLLACVFSLPISKMLSDVIFIAIFNSPAELTIRAAGFLIWLAAVLVLSVLASVIPARNAASLTIREVLAYE